jgi:hypothetical protein
MRQRTSAIRTFATTLPAFAVWFASVACMLACLSGCVGIKASACSLDHVVKKAEAKASKKTKHCSTSACCHEAAEETEPVAAPKAETTDIAAFLASSTCLVEHHENGECCALGGKEIRFLTSQGVSPDANAVVLETPFFLLPAPTPTVTPRSVATYLPCRSGTYLRHCVFRI